MLLSKIEAMRARPMAPWLLQSRLPENEKTVLRIPDCESGLAARSLIWQTVALIFFL